MSPKQTKPHVMWTKDSTYDYLVMLSAMFKPEHGTHPTARTYSTTSRELSKKHSDDYDVDYLKSKFHKMRKDNKAYLLVQSHNGLGWDEVTKKVSCPNDVKKKFHRGNPFLTKSFCILILCCIYFVSIILERCN